MHSDDRIHYADVGGRFSNQVQVASPPLNKFYPDFPRSDHDLIVVTIMASKGLPRTYSIFHYVPCSFLGFASNEIIGMVMIPVHAVVGFHDEVISKALRYLIAN
jgi:hypothetical protein